MPPLPEQVDIVAHLRDRLQRIDNLQAAAERTISRQTEYRSALITAAVTGKLDMHQLAIPATA